MKRRPSFSTGQLMLGGTGRTWTPQQEAIFAHQGPLCVDAKAGCGKTTTAAESGGRKLGAGGVAMFAFNLTAREDLCRKTDPDIHVKTLGQLGHSLLVKSLAHGKKRLPFDNPSRAPRFVKLVCDAGEQQPAPFRRAAATIVDKVRETLAPMTREGVRQIMARFDIDWADGRILTPDQRAEGNRVITDLSLEVLQRCLADTSIVDFPDQVWLPHMLNLPRAGNWSSMFVDEAQDLNNGQIALVQRVAGTDTEVTVIGDPYQAIYAWRGADSEAFSRLADAFGCARLPLSVTFRCGKRIVALARCLVPDFSAAPSNAEGEITDIDARAVLKHALPGDFILSRTNAPLLSYCLEAIQAGKPANILGRDVQRELEVFLRDAEQYLGENPSKPLFMKWLADWEAAEVGARIMEKRDPDPVFDKTACMRALWAYASTLSEARRTLSRLYVDESTGVARQRITLATTHKAKGLEADRVIVLEGTYNVGRSTEEDNLYYVAITRAKRHLVFANKDREAPAWADGLVARFP